LFIGSLAIANAIINFIRVVKEIEMKNEMIKFITFQMLQSEENGKLIPKLLYYFIMVQLDDQ
jgi:hypothetical protein